MSAGTTNTTAARSVKHVGVLTASYAESSGELKAVEDGYAITPAHFFAPAWPPSRGNEAGALTAPPADAPTYTFESIPIHKRTAYAQVRDAVKSGKYDCFFNLCDAAKDEDRAGVDVLMALEEFKVPYTGATSKHYEPTKEEMKMLVHYSGMKTPKGVVLRDPSPESIRRRCQRLKFPVIVKHVSGYSSVGMTKKSKCADMDALVTEVADFIATYERALVEEFISGDEATVLACADPSAPGGVRVFPPVMMRFPEGEDFKHFDLKWNSYDDIAWYKMAESHPAFQGVMDVGATAFKHIMDGIGYGRSDVRIDRESGDVYFLELNPNCGIMYAYGEEGSADWILRLAGANGAGHRDFIDLQIRGAIARHERLQPLYDVVLDDDTDAYVMEAARAIPAGRVVFEDEGRPTRLFTRDHVEGGAWDAKELQLFRENAWPMGCDQHVYAVWDKEPSQWRPVSHSCQPNMRFVKGRSLNVEAMRDIAVGERLTMDYRTFMDASTPPFECRCGAAHCDGTIFMDQTPGFLERTERGKAIASFHRGSPSRLTVYGEESSASSRSPVNDTAMSSPPGHRRRESDGDEGDAENAEDAEVRRKIPAAAGSL